MILQDGSCSEWYPTARKPTLSTFFRAVVLHRRDLHKENVVTCRDMCKAVSNPSMTHAQPDSPGLHGQGNNGGIDALNTWKEHEGTNCTQ